MKPHVRLIASIATGAFGGLICGFIILSFGFYIGKSGNYALWPNEAIGRWNPPVALSLAAIYGIPLGAIVFPIGYHFCLRNAPIRKALALSTVGTLIGGLGGAFIGPPFAAIVGVAGFLITASFLDQEKE